jgi:hypothetical protein
LHHFAVTVTARLQNATDLGQRLPMNLFAIVVLLNGQSPPPLPELGPPVGGQAVVEAAPVACADGQSISADTAGHCCWAGQAWNGTRCIGIPTSCPPAHAADPGTQSCALIPCAVGMVRVDDVHCCWQDQVYASGQQRCVGVPRCPANMNLSGETCVQRAGAPPPPPTAAATAAAPTSAPAGEAATAGDAPAAEQQSGDDGTSTVLIIVGVAVGAALLGVLLVVLLTSEEDGSSSF